MAAVARPLVEPSPIPPPTTASVVICAGPDTRWDDLVAGVEALERQTQRPDQLVIVIDHDDVLLERAADFFAEHDHLIPTDVVANTRARGLRGARNAAMSWCHGDVIAFLGDDVRAADDYWLVTMMEDYLAPDVAGVGGAATPDWDGDQPPRWFPAEFGWVVGCTHAGMPDELAEVDGLISCNMSFRREVFDHVGGFGDEPDEFCGRVRRRLPAARLVFDPDLEVTHRVDAASREFAVFGARCWTAGRARRTPALDRDALTGVMARGIARGITDGLRGRAGFRRAGAIVVGTGCVVGGRAAAAVRTVGKPRFGPR